MPISFARFVWNTFERALETFESWLLFSWKRWGIPFVLVVVTAGGLALHEVWPRHTVWEHHQGEAPGRVDQPAFLPGDGAYYRIILISMIEDRDLDIRNNLEAEAYYAASQNVALGKHGNWYPKHPILMPLVAIPAYAIGGDLGLLTFNVVQLVALLMVIWLGARRYVSDHVAVALVLWYAFGTMLRSAAYNFAPDIFSTLIVSSGLVALLYKRPALGGLLLGFALWAKWTNLVFIPIAALYLLVRCEWRSALRFAGCSAIGLIGLLSLNDYMFGSPFLTPYDRALIEVDGQMRPWISHRTFFTRPFWLGLWDQLTDKNLGLLVACPPVLFALPGLVVIALRARSEALLLGGVCIAQLATFAKYNAWNSSSYGPRFLLTVVVMSALLTAPALGWLLKVRPMQRFLLPRSARAR